VKVLVAICALLAISLVGLGAAIIFSGPQLPGDEVSPSELNAKAHTSTPELQVLALRGDRAASRVLAARTIEAVNNDKASADTAEKMG